MEVRSRGSAPGALTAFVSASGLATGPASTADAVLACGGLPETSLGSALESASEWFEGAASKAGDIDPQELLLSLIVSRVVAAAVVPI